MPASLRPECGARRRGARGAVPNDDEAMRDLADVAIHHPVVCRLLAPASPRHVPLAHVPPLHVSSVCRFMLPRKTGLASIHMMVRPMPSGGRGAARAPHAGSTDPHCTARRRQHTKSRKLRGRNAMLPAGTSAAIALASLVALAALPSAAAAQEVLKLGLIQSMTGAFNTTGKAAVNGAQIYLKQHGDTVAGRKIQLVIKDDAAAPDAAKRLAQDLIVNEKVGILGVGITPSALTIAPLATEGRIATLVLVSGASVTVERSPYLVRTSFTLAQSSAIIADWAVKNGARKIVTIVNDWAPGLEAEASFRGRIAQGGAEIVESMRVPLANPDLAPFLQRARDDKPDTLFVYFPGFQAGLFAKQFLERGLDKSAIRIIGPGDLTDDDELPAMTDAMLGIVTAHHYSAVHDSPLNKTYVADFEKAFGKRPNFVSVGGYDAMHLIYEALKKTGGKSDGDTLIAAMKGMKWESPRGPIEVDPRTRDVVHNEYIRKVERVNGALSNVEFETYPMVKDPVKEAKR
jgi:branched-chain amino acid transport system substrate-binding protein